jgi:uncharacterized DUF497 family protein
MEFEFDPLKSASNREKHGVDFIQAQEDRIRIISVRRARDEEIRIYEV